MGVAWLWVREPRRGGGATRRIGMPSSQGTSKFQAKSETPIQLRGSSKEQPPPLATTRRRWSSPNLVFEARVGKVCTFEVEVYISFLITSIAKYRSNNKKNYV